MKPLRITLVRANERSDPDTPVEEANVTGLYPPLGIAYLAAALQLDNHDVRLLDAHALNLDPRQVAAEISARGDRLVGITSTTLNWIRALQVADAVKTAAPDCVLAVGGPQLSIFPREALFFEVIDIAVVGEGEDTIREIAAAVAEGTGIHGIPGTVTKENGKIRMHAAREPIGDLDSIPFPAINLLPLEKYRALTIRRPFLTMITSRGCPYRCGFCSQVYVGGTFRQRSPRNVFAEMAQYVRQYRVREIILFDETFTVGEERVLEICDRIVSSRLKFRWNIRTRADTVTARMLKALRRAGCYGVHIGIESGDPRILEVMKKDISLPQIRQAVRWSREAGLETRGYFMIGYPGETIEEIKRTIAFSTQLGLDWASYSITVPQPATDIQEDAVRMGLMAPDYWLKFSRREPCPPLPYFTTPNLNTATLEKLHRQAYRRFYARPALILRKLFSKRLYSNLIDLTDTVAYLATR